MPMTAVTMVATAAFTVGITSGDVTLRTITVTSHTVQANNPLDTTECLSMNCSISLKIQTLCYLNSLWRERSLWDVTITLFCPVQE